MNFATHFLAVRGRTLRVYARDPEAKAIVAVLAISCLFASVYLLLTGTYPDFWTALRFASFNLVTIATDCGLRLDGLRAVADLRADVDAAPELRHLRGRLDRRRHQDDPHAGAGPAVEPGDPAAAASERGAAPADRRPDRSATKSPLPCWPLRSCTSRSVVTSTFALLLTGSRFRHRLQAVIACINNAGPGLGLVGPASNYGVLDDLQTWILSFVMILGRLEIFTVLVLFTPAFWRK